LTKFTTHQDRKRPYNVTRSRKHCCDGNATIPSVCTA